MEMEDCSGSSKKPESQTEVSPIINTIFTFLIFDDAHTPPCVESVREVNSG